MKAIKRVPGKTATGQIREDILENIKVKTWLPGERIPPERVLAEQYSVSVGTVRNALQVLVHDGILSRFQGRGTFVTSSAEHFEALRYYRFASDFTEDVKPLAISCLSNKVVGPLPKIAELLKYKPNEKFHEIIRTFKKPGNDNSIVYAKSYLPVSLFPDFGQVVPEALEYVTLYKFIEAQYSMPTLSTKEGFSAIPAPPIIAEEFNLQPATPVLRIEMMVSSYRDVHYEYRISYCATEHIQIIR